GVCDRHLHSAGSGGGLPARQRALCRALLSRALTETKRPPRRRRLLAGAAVNPASNEKVERAASRERATRSVVSAEAATVCRLFHSADTERCDDKDAVHNGGGRHSSSRYLRPRFCPVPDLQLSTRTRAGLCAARPGFRL